MPTHVISANGAEADPTTGDVQLPIFQRKTILTDAQIKASTTFYPELVPAPGAGKMILLHSASLNGKTQYGPYSNVIDSIVNIVYGDYDAVITPDLSLSSFVNSDVSERLDPNHGLIYPKIQTGGGYAYGDGFYGYDQKLNKPLKFGTYHNGAGTGAYTGGHASNTIEITVFYSIVDL